MKPFARTILVTSLALAAGNGIIATKNTRDLKEMKSAMKKMMMAALFAAM